MIKRLGPLPRQEIGLRRIIIQNMAKHIDLAKLVALDIYLGNNDRSHPNVFYDRKNNAFYGIDMGNCLTGNLALYAKENIQRIIEEKKGLNAYKKTLQQLVIIFPAAKIIQMLEDTLQKAGFVEANPLLWSEDLENRINKWKMQIELNYQSTLSLIAFLEFNNI